MVSELTTNEQQDTNDLEQAARSFFAKLVMADSYQPSGCLVDIPVTLVKPSQRDLLPQHMGEDYNLGQVIVVMVFV